MTINTNEVLGERYPARRLLALIGDKWTPVVVYCLARRRRRFSDLHRSIPGISKKMLIQVLRALERDGLVNRTLYPVVPPRTEYELTREGKHLHKPIAALCRWAARNEKLLGMIERRREAARPGGTGEA